MDEQNSSNQNQGRGFNYGSVITRYYEKLVTQGQVEKLPADRRVTARSANVLALAFIVWTLILAALAVKFQIGLALFLCTLAVPLFLSIFYYNFQGKHQLAKWVALGSTNCFVFLLALLLPKETSMVWGFLVPFVMSRSLFGDPQISNHATKSEKVTSYSPYISYFFGVLLPVSLFFLREAFPDSPLILSHEAMMRFRLFIEGSLWAFLYFQLRHWASVSRKLDGIGQDNDLKTQREVEKMFSVSLDLMGTAGFDGFFKRINPRFEEILGFSLQELRTKPFLDLVHPEDRQSTIREMKYLADGKATLNFENRYRKKDGVYRILNWSAASFQQDGVIYFSARDVTDERAKELKLAQASKMSSLGEMSAGVAHEINNPLLIIKGRVDQIKKALRCEPPAVTMIEGFANSIENTSDRIAEIVNSLLIFAREGTKDPFAVKSVKSLFDEALVFCAKRFANAEIQFLVRQFPDVLTVECRPTQICQVLVNLLNNAFDAVVSSADRWVAIDAIAVGDFVEISVTDSGKGVARNIQNKILEPFFTTKDVGKGTGLGLSISLGIIKSHFGDLTLDVHCDNTRFVMRLPRVQPRSVGAHQGQSQQPTELHSVQENPISKKAA